MSDGILEYGRLFDADAETREFKLEALSLRLSHAIVDAMVARGMSRIDLARTLDVSAPMVTKILSGRSNFTLKTMVAVADALGYEFDPIFRPRESIVGAESLEAPGTDSATSASRRPISRKPLPVCRESSGPSGAR